MTFLPQGVVLEVNNDPQGSSTPIASSLVSFGNDWGTLRAKIAEAWVQYQKFWHIPRIQILPHPKDAELPTTLPAPVTYGSTLDGVGLVAYPGLF